MCRQAPGPMLSVILLINVLGYCCELDVGCALINGTCIMKTKQSIIRYYY